MAHLEEDISEVLPYLNASLEGFLYIEEPPSVSFRVKGRVVVVFPDRIGITVVKDEIEADEILDWMKERINEAWERRLEIAPRFEPFPRPSVVEILKTLQGASCIDCGEASCVSFAVRVAEGEKQPDDCPAIPEEKREKLKEYLSCAWEE
jgi:ArsR family metal-binding transcriptional regulator